MKRSLSGFFAALLLTVSFCFPALADAYTGAYITTEVDPITGEVLTVVNDLNPSGQTFSGENVIQTGINQTPVLTDNTFNGSTEMNILAVDVTSEGNEYNDSVEINYVGTDDSFLTSTNDSYENATVNSELSAVSFNNSTFSGSTTLNANSITLGSITQMDSLIVEMRKIYESIMRPGVQAAEGSSFPSYDVTITSGSSSESITMPGFVFFALSHSDGVLTSTRYSARASFSAMLGYYWRYFMIDIQQLFDYLIYHIKDVVNLKANYRIYTFTSSGETYTLTSEVQNIGIREAMASYLRVIIQLLNYQGSKFFAWYYPLDSDSPYYWRFYNTDTDLQEDIGLAGLMYNISWYLGEIYQNMVASGTQLTEDAEDLADSIGALNTAEETVNQSIQSAFGTVSGIMQLPVISAAATVVGWIEYMWVSLGIFQSPTLLAYMCVVLMMVIGYARFKGVFK